MLKRFSLLVLLMACSSVVLAQYDHPHKNVRSKFGSRDGRLEASLMLTNQSSASRDSEGGSSLDIDSTMGWGLSVGWNWTAKLNLSYRFLTAKPSYLAVVVPDDPDALTRTVEHEATKTSHQLNATYNFKEGKFTPYISGGIGLAKLDSNIASGPPDVDCWWDPWWGYICYGDWKTYSASKFTYNLGAGVRWDINNIVFSKAAYNREVINVETGSLNFNTVTVEVGLMF